jgi:hypothetical protein
MEPEELTWRRTIEEEKDASTAAVEAERVLHQLVQRHLASSLEVDAAVVELDLRRSESARKLTHDSRVVMQLSWLSQVNTSTYRLIHFQRSVNCT